MNENIVKLEKWIKESDNIVFFGGAGVSTESGIPDFRSVDGLYNQKYDYPPETILSHSFFMRNTEEFYRFYRDKMLYKDAKPNKAHYALAELEKHRFQGHYPILFFYEPSFLWSAGKELPNAQKRYQYLQTKGWKMGGEDSL